MKEMIRGLGVIALVGAIVAGYFYWQKSNDEPLVAQTAVPTPAAPAPAASETPAPPPPTEHFPIEQAQPPATPPPPANVPPDQSLADGLRSQLGAETFATLFIPGDLIRHLVVTIDNLPREKVAYRLLPIKPTNGKLAVSGTENSLQIAADNSARYAPYVKLAGALDAKAIVGLYVHLYPAFQQAYQDLGYPDGYFNDRLIFTINHLIAAPEIHEPIALVHPSVWYEFADPQLEALSAGQKMMIRLGPDNEAIIKAKLREILHQLTANHPSGSTGQGF